MTDAELAKAVADACGIEVYWNIAENAWFDCGYREEFNPARSFDDAMMAANKCGLFDEDKHRAELHRCDGQWRVLLPVGGVRDAMNDSGPRAICEAILAVKGMGT